MSYFKTFEEFVNESNYPEYILNFVNEMSTSKDLKRINDIINKSGGDEIKAKALANKMATLIKDKQKSLGRYEAALELLGPEHPVTIVFAEKATSLGNNITGAKTSEPKNTLGKLGSESSTTKNQGNDRPYTRDTKYYSGSPILPLGSTNLMTGKCKYFNIYSTWGEDNSTTIEVWKDSETGKYKLVFTSGAGPIAKIGTMNGFIHDQSSKALFYGELIDWANIGDAELIVRRYNIKSAPGYTYK